MAGEDAIIYKRRAMSEKLLKFRTCMGEAMKGRKFERMEDRLREFCIQAKLCSGRSKDREEAIKLCREAHPEWRWE
ncbi:MAG: hypothetical protein QMC85_07405 [Methanocellales archaeon]|nr:hypothetical protein [Methanocellales archaeon]